MGKLNTHETRSYFGATRSFKQVDAHRTGAHHKPMDQPMTQAFNESSSWKNKRDICYLDSVNEIQVKRSRSNTYGVAQKWFGCIDASTLECEQQNANDVSRALRFVSF